MIRQQVLPPAPKGAKCEVKYLIWGSGTEDSLASAITGGGQAFDPSQMGLFIAESVFICHLDRQLLKFAISKKAF